MRVRFEQQTNLGTTSIYDITFPLNSRDGLPAVGMGLKHIFITPTLNKAVFELLEQKIVGDKKKTGRKGMDLWHILVLAVIRHSCNTDWDTLETMSNYHELVRKVLGVHSTGFIQDKDKYTFCRQTILDNVSLLDEDLLQQINALVTEAGQTLVKKKGDDTLSLKTDSYVVEKNVEFPYDLNLLWESIRKTLDTIPHLVNLLQIKGWRKIKALKKNIHILGRNAANAIYKKSNKENSHKLVKKFLSAAKKLSAELLALIEKYSQKGVARPKQVVKRMEDLKRYNDYILKFSNQVERRILKGEVIPASEKIFSIFEEDTEWLTKGKRGKLVELGHAVLVTTDQYHFIVDYKVLEKENDVKQVADLSDRLQKRYPSTTIRSHSFDKGFWSVENLATLEKASITEVVLPKKGRQSAADKEREGSDNFKKYRRKHSAIESNINMLEHHGLSKCMDKGIKGFKRCVGVSVLAYNLHKIGNVIIAKELEVLKRQQRKQQLKKAA
jgi:IS5 family transposase